MHLHCSIKMKNTRNRHRTNLPSQQQQPNVTSNIFIANNDTNKIKNQNKKRIWENILDRIQHYQQVPYRIKVVLFITMVSWTHHFLLNHQDGMVAVDNNNFTRTTSINTKIKNESALASVSSSWGVKKTVDIDNSSQQYIPSSTESLYKSNDRDFYGSYALVREGLDYTYHSNYQKSRQILQDNIIHEILTMNQSNITSPNDCNAPPHESPWIVFTAGVMGAGKTHTIRLLAQKQYFPLQEFVIIDPDEIRRHLPEYELYTLTHPELAGEYTRKEAGYISEIAINVALQQRQNVLIDGSLRDSHWYHEYFNFLKRKHNIKIAILHITASIDHIWTRVKKRSEKTGRVVPKETIIHALEHVPRSIDVLAPMSDFFCEINNDEEEDNNSAENSVRLVKPVGMSWDLFRQNWEQSCSSNSGNRNTIPL